MSTIRSYHGAEVFHRGIDAPRSRFHGQGKFGRLFPTLPPHRTSMQALLALGKPGGAMDPGTEEKEDNDAIDAGFVFFGQFIDHDITFDTTSSLEQQNDPEAIQNFRTPVLELDSVYGSGPSVNPFLYKQSGRQPAELLIDPGYPRDLPRNSEGTALIGDPRNDENIIISQLQLAFLKFHNAVVRDLPDGDAQERFDEAQTIVRWHYQWLVLHEFLPRVVSQGLLDDVYRPGVTGSGRRFFDWRHQPFIPVEFAVAAYRFGHALIPGKLRVNDEFRVRGSHHVPLFDFEQIGDADPDDLSGGRRAPRRYVDWRYLFDTGHGAQQPGKVITPQLSRPLFELPFFAQADDVRSLAQRNLLRGLSFSLPSGQAVACAMGEEALSAEDLRDVRWLEYVDEQTGYSRELDTGYDVQTPLWYYILKEAEVREAGKRLGPVGGRIVAEVLVGLLEGDRRSFVRADPYWKPTYGYNGEFRMRDLLEVAGVHRTAGALEAAFAG